MAKFVARMIVFFDNFFFFFTSVQQICIRKNNCLWMCIPWHLSYTLIYFTLQTIGRVHCHPNSCLKVQFHHSPLHTLSFPAQGSPSFQFLSGVLPFEPRWLKCDIFFEPGQQEKKRVSHFLSGTHAFFEVSPVFMTFSLFSSLPP